MTIIKMIERILFQYSYVEKINLSHLDLLELMLVLLRDLYESPLLITFLPWREKFLSL